jgi:hypothetical protein
MDDSVPTISLRVLEVEIKLRKSDVEDVLRGSRMTDERRREYINMLRSTPSGHVFEESESGNGMLQGIAPDLMEKGAAVIYDDRSKKVVDHVTREWVWGSFYGGYSYRLPDGREFLLQVILIE